ncbi:hypothetical protein GDO81_027197 [Engystomops pustulosus]|uniref:Uncharacterized protein n=1 Tax=Engystomops pustulosus TaxID=76066 RepID=A0AAV6YQJ2_ENGPU|nr:hypothetical protein GDO81_027197 [Engystomops pustulosus]
MQMIHFAKFSIGFPGVGQRPGGSQLPGGCRYMEVPAESACLTRISPNRLLNRSSQKMKKRNSLPCPAM